MPTPAPDAGPGHARRSGGRQAAPHAGSGRNLNTPHKIYVTHPNARFAVGDEIVSVDTASDPAKGIVLGHVAEDRLMVRWANGEIRQEAEDEVVRVADFAWTAAPGVGIHNVPRGVRASRAASADPLARLAAIAAELPREDARLVRAARAVAGSLDWAVPRVRLDAARRTAGGLALEAVRRLAASACPRDRKLAVELSAAARAALGGS